jgi:hypothetical protein
LPKVFGFDKIPQDASDLQANLAMPWRGQIHGLHYSSKEFGRLAVVWEKPVLLGSQ